MFKFGLLLCLMGLMLTGGCGSTAGNGPQSAPLDRRVKLLPNEETAVPDTDLKLTLKEVMRSWRADGTGEFPTATINIKLGTMEVQRSLNLGDFVELGDYQITLKAANPFGKTDCEVQVVRH